MGLINNILNRFGYQKNTVSIGGLNFYPKNFTDNSSLFLEQIYNKIANDISVATIKHIIKKDDKNWEEMKTSNLAYVVGFKPNIYQSQADLMYCITYSLLKYGIAIVVPEYKKGSTSKTQLKHLHFINETTSIKIEGEKLFFLDDDNSENSINLEDVIIIRNRPISLFENANLDLSNYIKLLDVYLQSNFEKIQSENQIEGYLKLSGALDPKRKQEAVNQFNESITSSGIGVVDATTDFHQISRGNNQGKQSRDIDLFNQTSEELYKAFGLNKAIFTADATEQQMLSYYNSTLQPILKKIKQEFSAKLITQEMFMRGHRLEISVPKFDNSNMQSFTAFADKMIYNGIMSVNEVRESIDMAPIENGDVYYTNKNAVVVNDEEISEAIKGGDTNE